MAKPILDLDSLTDRPVIQINGHEHWLITPDVMPVLDNYTFTKKAARADALAAKTDLTDEERQELQVLPDELCRLVLDAPDAVHGGLNDRQRMLIVATAYSTFRTGLRMMPPHPAAPESSPASPTGETSSPA